jgi:hypothetical protein
MHVLGTGSNSNATKSGVVGVVAVEDSHKASASSIQQTALVCPVLDDYLAHPVARLRHNKSARVTWAAVDAHQLDLFVTRKRSHATR